MTEVAFHFGAPDKLAYACRLLRKASASGARVLVVAEAAVAHALDQALWTLAPSSFIAHAGPQAQAALQARSAVVLVTPDEGLPPGFTVLVNLTGQVPQGFERLARLIEVVSTDEADRQLARLRWKRYQQLGYDIVRHDLHLQASTP